MEGFITRNPELKGQGKNVVSSLEDLKKEALPKQLSDFESGLIDEQTFRNRVVVGRGDKKRTPEYTQAASKRKYKRVMADPERKARLKETQARFTEKKYLEKGMFPSAKKPKDAFWRDLLRAADKNDRISWVSERPNKFPRNVFEGLELMDNKTGKKITYNNLSNHPQYSKAIKTYEKKFLINQLDIPYDIKEKITYQRKPGGMTNNIVIQHPEGIGKNPFNTSLATQFENLLEDKIKNKFNKNFNKAETLTEKKQLVKNFMTELSKETPSIISQPGKKPYGSEKTLSELASKGLDKNELRIFNTALEKLNSKEQSVLTGFGNKVAMGLDPTDIIKALPEKEAQILKGVGSKIGNVAKLGARGAQELLVGTGPLGIGLTALISLPLAINELSEGARGSEAIQNTISDLTFGLTPRSDERIIKEIGGESAVKGMEIQKNIDDYKSITQEINNLENQMRDPSFLSLSPDDQDRIQSSFVQNEKALKEKENFLIPLINEKGKLDSPEYEDYLQADRKRQLERGIILKTREQQSDIYDLGGEALREEEYVRPEASLLLDPLRKTFVGNQPKQTTYPSAMQGTVGEPVDNIIDRNFAYSVGGRVGFKKGSKDKDSPVIPISPLTDLPQNESRRDFLKGIGAVGLGAVALGSGLLKLGKSLKTKEALSLLGKEAVGQPEWFAPLVDKIILKGIRLEKDGKKLDSYVLQEGDKTLTLNKNPSGTIEVDVQGGGAYDDTFTLRYNNSIGKNMYGEPTEFRDFKIIESRPKYQVSGMDESGFDYDLEPMEEYFSGKDLLKLEKNATGILSDVEGLEKIATGKIKDPKLAKTREQVRKKLIKIPAEDRIIENYDYQYDIDIPHEYND
jgi:hypothetical protein